MSILETILFAGWLIPVIFIGMSAIYVTTIMGRKQLDHPTHDVEKGAVRTYPTFSSESAAVSQRAA